MDEIPSDLIPVSENPDCSEAPLRSLESWITPTSLFFKRSHFDNVPNIDASSWNLKVVGEVEQPLEISYKELISLPSRTSVVTLECAGNSRSYVTPPAEGLSFRHGAVGNAKWTGVPLHDVLSRAKPTKSAVEALFDGADSGMEEEYGLPLELDYSRSLPILEAMSERPLLAYQMNDEPLEPTHGYPVRLIVPGWYGMASVKWLKQINLIPEPYQGFFQSQRYINVKDGKSQTSWEPVSSIQVKSLITNPDHGEVVQKGDFTIQGVAWSGHGTIEMIEVSIDGGRIWEEADLFGPESPGAWHHWKLTRTASSPGHFILMSRATDSAGYTQPHQIAWNFRGYANNSIHTIAIEVPSK